MKKFRILRKINKQFEQQPSQSFKSEEKELNQQKINEILRNQNDQDSLAQKQFNYANLLHIHNKPTQPSKFPFHCYLKEHYDKLSLKEQMRIFLKYFKADKENPQQQQIQFDKTHVGILNQTLNLFPKVPPNAILFISITNFNQHQDLFLIKNFDGEIIYFQTFENYKGIKVMLKKIKRKIKGRPFLIINDQTIQNTLPNQKIFIYLAKSFKFLYRKKFQFSQRSKIKKQFFSGLKVKFKKIGHDSKIIFENLEEHQFYSYTEDPHVSFTKKSFLTFKKFFFNRFNVLEQNEIQLLQNNVNLNLYGTRLLIFDFLYINFVQTTSLTKEKLVQKIQKLSLKYANVNFENVDTKLDHFPLRTLNSQRCKYCEIVINHQNKKSKYKCLACSKKFQIDIPLCIECWGDFHQQIFPIVKNSSGQRLRSAYLEHQKGMNKKARNFPFFVSQLKENYIQNKEIKQKVLKLDQNLNIFQQSFESLNFWQGSEKLLQKTTQFMLINIIDTYSSIIDKVKLEQMKNINRSQSQQSNQPKSQKSIFSNNKSQELLFKDKQI